MEMPLWKKLRGSNISAEGLLDIFAIKEPPVPVIGMAQGLGIDVYYRENASWDGMLSIAKDESDARIFIKKEHAETRQRFTVAHELGHLILHPGQNVYRDTSYLSYENSAERRQETEANQFAANLLMPAWMVEFAFDRMRLAPAQLASFFNVSPEAMHYRLKDLGIISYY